MIDAKTEVLGLFAHPIGHSLPPLLQNTLAMVCEENVAYLPFRVKNPEELGAAICGAHAFGVAGFNVTVPYRETVTPHFCGLSKGARLIGVVDTSVRTGEGYVEHNTDIVGMATMLARRSLRMEGAHILLFGAGGTAQSVAVLAATGGAAKLVILNRNTACVETPTRAARDADPFLTMRTTTPEHWCKLLGNDYLCIQCTNVGMRPNTGETVVKDPRFFEELSVAADTVYTPEETKFLRLARAIGKSVTSGLAMPISQGVHAFLFWTGKRCMVEQKEELLMLAKGALPIQGKAEKGLRKVFAYRRIQQTIWRRMDGGLTYDFCR